jgi:hypothetical protein
MTLYSDAVLLERDPREYLVAMLESSVEMVFI